MSTPSGSYMNPLRSIKNLVAERIDQGVDYSGSGPIYAIGNGVITNVNNAGWPNGTFISYQLSDGPYAGHYVYAAEDIHASVKVGQQVTSSTVIGQMFEGGSGIETGWATPPGTGTALGSTQFNGSNVTAYGLSFSNLLHSLGAPAGIKDSPVSGTVPAAFNTPVTGAPTSGGGGGLTLVAAGFNPLAPFLGFWKDITGQATGIADVATSITSVVSEISAVMKWVSWLFQPKNWVRIGAGLLGLSLFVAGSIMLVVSAQ
jgi:hypothetical protein